MNENHDSLLEYLGKAGSLGLDASDSAFGRPFDNIYKFQSGYSNTNGLKILLSPTTEIIINGKFDLEIHDAGQKIYSEASLQRIENLYISHNGEPATHYVEAFLIIQTFQT